jgi:hypothetical protein
MLKARYCFAALCVLFCLWGITGCDKNNRTVEDHFEPSVRFLNAMIPAGALSLLSVQVDGRVGFPLGLVGNVSWRRTLSDGHHQIQVTARSGQDPYGRIVLTTDLQLESANRAYTCVLVGEIPDSGIDSSAVALLFYDDTYRGTSRAAIRLVNATLDRDSCDLVWKDRGDSVMIGKVAHLQASDYVPLAPRDYQFRARGAASYDFLFVLDSTTHYGLSFYFVGATNYGQDQYAPYIVVVTDTIRTET